MCPNLKDRGQDTYARTGPASMLRLNDAGVSNAAPTGTAWGTVARPSKKTARNSPTSGILKNSFLRYPSTSILETAKRKLIQRYQIRARVSLSWAHLTRACLSPPPQIMKLLWRPGTCPHDPGDLPCSPSRGRLGAQFKRQSIHSYIVTVKSRLTLV